MGDVTLTKDQAAVLTFVLEHVQADDHIETLSLRLSGDFADPYFAAVLAIGADESGTAISLVVSLPVHGQGVFMAVTAAKHQEVARLLANLEDYERETGHVLRPHETVVTNGPGDIKALFLLPTVTHRQLAGLPGSAQVNSLERTFSVVLGINAMEYACKAKGGVIALLDRLEAIDKSLLIFKDPHSPSNPSTSPAPTS